MDAIPTIGFLPLALGFMAVRSSQGNDPALALALADKLAQQILEAPPPRVMLSPTLELETIVPLDFAAQLQSTSIDTLERENQRRIAKGEPSQIIPLSARRKGMRIKHALRLA